MRILQRFALLAAALVVAAAPQVHGQSAGEIFDRMLAAHERRTEGIENYTLVQETMGFETVMYFEREAVNGRSLLRLKRTTTMGVTVDAEEDDAGFNEIYEVAHQLAEHATYAGRDEVDGRAVHVLRIDDLADIDFGHGAVDEDSDFVPERGTIYVDTDLLIPRRMEFEGSMTTEQGTTDVTSVVDLHDYREIEGMLVPFRTVVEMQGLAEAIDPEMRQQYEEMKRQLAEMPESQRAMAERMMKGQLEQIEKMMQGDAMVIEMTVTDVRVNAGPPSE
jgi:hypothetical protein